MATRKEYDGYDAATSIKSNDLIKYKDGSSGTVYKITEANLSAQVQDDLFDNAADTAIASTDKLVKEASDGTKKTVTEAILSAQVFSDIASTDGTLDGNSDTVLPTEKAVKTYADTKMANLVDDTTPELGGNLNAGYKKITRLGCVQHEGCVIENDYGNSCATGYRSVARQYAQWARSGEVFGISYEGYGIAQHTISYQAIKTTNADVTELWYSEMNEIPTGGIFAYTITINGSNSDGTVAGFYKRMAYIKNIGGTTSLIGAVQTIGTDIEVGSIGGISEIIADDTNDAIIIKVQGKVDETIRWHAIFECNEIGFY